MGGSLEDMLPHKTMLNVNVNMPQFYSTQDPGAWACSQGNAGALC